jgi:hypothetical protein
LDAAVHPAFTRGYASKRHHLRPKAPALHPAGRRGTGGHFFDRIGPGLVGLDGGDDDSAGEKLAEQIMAAADRAGADGFHINLIKYQKFSFLTSTECAEFMKNP